MVLADGSVSSTLSPVMVDPIGATLLNCEVALTLMPLRLTEPMFSLKVTVTVLPLKLVWALSNVGRTPSTL